jgi:hypothetical protein
MLAMPLEFVIAEPAGNPFKVNVTVRPASGPANVVNVALRVVVTPYVAVEGATTIVTGIGVGVGVLVGVGVGVLVGVSVGVFVGVFVGVSVGVSVGVFAGVFVGVSVGVFVGVGVLVAVGVSVGVGVLVAVDVDVGVRVGVGGAVAHWPVTVKLPFVVTALYVDVPPYETTI